LNKFTEIQTMYSLTDADFGRLKFAVHKTKPTDDILKKIPGLGVVSGFVNYQSPDATKVIRYCCFMYDSGSPFISMFPDVVKRKQECALYSGFSSIDSDIVNNLFSFTDPAFLEMVHQFLVYQNNRIWSMIVSSEQTFYEYQQKLLRPVTDADGDKNLLQATQIKSKLMQDCDDINARLESYYRRFYGDDEVLINKSEGFRRFTPEDIANLK
jgi:hypothetical protein